MNGLTTKPVFNRFESRRNWPKWAAAILSATLLHAIAIPALMRPAQPKPLPLDEIVINLGLLGAIASPTPSQTLALTPAPTMARAPSKAQPRDPAITPQKTASPTKPLPPKPRPVILVAKPVPGPELVQIVHAPSPILVNTMSPYRPVTVQTLTVQTLTVRTLTVRTLPLAAPISTPLPTPAPTRRPALNSMNASASASASAAPFSDQTNTGNPPHNMGTPHSSGIGSSGPEQVYYAKLVARMKRYKRYPASARKNKEEGVVVLQFTVNRGGRITRAHVIQSSGHKSLDACSLRILKRVQPLPPFPAAMKQKSVTLTYPFKFKLRAEPS